MSFSDLPRFAHSHANAPGSRRPRDALQLHGQHDPAGRGLQHVDAAELSGPRRLHAGRRRDVLGPGAELLLHVAPGAVLLAGAARRAQAREPDGHRRRHDLRGGRLAGRVRALLQDRVRLPAGAGDLRLRHRLPRLRGGPAPDRDDARLVVSAGRGEEHGPLRGHDGPGRAGTRRAPVLLLDRPGVGHRLQRLHVDPHALPARGGVRRPGPRELRRHEPVLGGGPALLVPLPRPAGGGVRLDLRERLDVRGRRLEGGVPALLQPDLHPPGPRLEHLLRAEVRLHAPPGPRPLRQRLQPPQPHRPALLLPARLRGPALRVQLPPLGLRHLRLAQGHRRRHRGRRHRRLHRRTNRLKSIEILTCPCATARPGPRAFRAACRRTRRGPCACPGRPGARCSG